MSSRVVLPVVDLEQNSNVLRKTVLKGVKQLSVQKIQSTTNALGSSQFNIIPPSQNTVIDRRIDLCLSLGVVNGGGNWNNTADVNGIVAATGKAVGANCNINHPRSKAQLATGVVAGTAATFAQVGAAAVNDYASASQFISDNDLALRQFPLASCMDNIDITINGTHFTDNVNDYLHAIMTYTSKEQREAIFEGSAHHPDVNSDYRNTLGKDDHPLSFDADGRKGETCRGKLTSRGANVRFNGATMTVDLTEPLFIRPLLLAHGKGMTNINDIQIVINWNQNKIARMLSCWRDLRILRDGAQTWATTADGTTRLNITAASWPTTSNVVVKYFTPQDDIEIPQDIILPIQTPQHFFETIPNAVAAGANIVHTSRNMRLNQVPDCVYIWCCPPKQNKTTAYTPDYFSNIQSVSVTFGNQVGILSGVLLEPNATINETLVKIAKENGCDILNSSEVNKRGYVLKLKFGKDIPLEDNESPGTRGDYSIQFQVNALDVRGDAIAVADVNNEQGVVGDPNAAVSFNFNALFMLNGEAIISPNECRYQDGLLTYRDNLEASDMGHKYDGHAHGLHGGGLFSSLKGLFTSAPHMISQAVSAAPAILNTVGSLLDTVDSAKQTAGRAQQTYQQGRGAYNQARGRGGGSATGGALPMGGSRSGGYKSRLM
tara:strand:+ start:20535 stop:22514 length:1980 start_codon:yes stop_codon:yes gene_type:complete